MQPKNEILPDTDLGEYRLVELIGPQTWRARHLIAPREVCLRVLTRSTASDPARRDEILSRIRSAATIAHPAFPPVRNATVADGWLVVVTDLPAAVPFDEWLGTRRLSMHEWGKLAWQLFSALDALHENGIVHGGIDGTTLRIDDAGNARIDIPGFAALTGRAERGDLTFLANELTAAQLAHRSPEALAGAPIDSKADLFSCGVLLYRAMTGLSPFEAATAEEVASRVTNQNPRNPREIDSEIPVPALTVVGRCLFKKPSARYPGAKAVFQDLRALDPSLETIAAYPRERRAGAKPAESRREVTNIFVADVPYWDMIEKRDPEAAARAAARMQQFLGESVYLYDGEVLDSLGHRFIAVVPEASGAVTAAYRALDELAPAVQSGDTFEPRILILRGEIERGSPTPAGEGLQQALDALESLSPGQYLVSGDVLSDARMHPSEPAVGRIAGVEMFALPARLPADTAPAPDESTLLVTPLEGEDTIAVAAPAPRPKRAVRIGVGVAVALLLAVVLLAFLVSRFRSSDVKTAPAAAASPAMEQETGVAVVLPAAGTLPDESRRIAAMVAASMRRLFQEHSGVTLVDESQTNVRRVSFAERPAALEANAARQEGGELPAAGAPAIVARLGENESPAFTIDDPDGAIRGMLAWVASSLGLSPESIVPPEGAAEPFGEATLALLDGNADRASGAIERAVELAPDWAPGWRLALDVHRKSGNRDAMLAAAREVARLQPENTPVRRLLAISAIEDGDRLAALQHAAAVLRSVPADEAALEIVGRYALAAGDVRRFEETVSRLEKLPNAQSARRLHRGDTAAMRGQLDAALNQYYTAEEREPDNARLAFKIGRVAALRGSMETAQLELDKLRRLDPDYGAPLLEAFILAQRREFDRLPSLLETAQKNARWNDDVWTHTAEVWAKAGERRRVMDALEKSIARGEANATLVLRQKPFFYLGYDQRGVAIQNQIEQNREAVELALADVGI